MNRAKENKDKDSKERLTKDAKRNLIEEVKKAKPMFENIDFVVGGTDKPFVPILDPKAHALTGEMHSRRWITLTIM